MNPGASGQGLVPSPLTNTQDTVLSLVLGLYSLFVRTEYLLTDDCAYVGVSSFIRVFIGVKI